MNGGEIAAKVILAHKVDAIFTLIGGHISPILVEAKKQGIRVIDTRHEVNAVFAADGWARLKGIPGVAVVTAGPGVTNTITAVRNAFMAQSPLVLIGGATATALRGRGSLQDIDQITLIRPNVKAALRVNKLKEISTTLHSAFALASSGVPGPVFVEIPVDLLYNEEIVREWYTNDSPKGNSLASRAIRTYLKLHVNSLFKGKAGIKIESPKEIQVRLTPEILLEKAMKAIQLADKPLVLAGSQIVRDARNAQKVKDALQSLGIPVYLSGMARGLLGADHAIQFKQKRKEALKECDLVILLGVPADFRLNYGAHIGKNAFQINVNLDSKDLRKNKKPNLAILADAGAFLVQLKIQNFQANAKKLSTWFKTLQDRERARETEIEETAKKAMKLINPVEFFLKARPALAKKTILVADGGDFVATGAYILKPGGPLTWLDPGVFGTLGVGAGFALGAKVARPDHDVVILYGDGSAGYSIVEYDTFVRHKIAVGAIIGNDACWTQIYRDQIVFLKDDVACNLQYSPYDEIARTFGGAGKTIKFSREISAGINALKKSLSQKKPFVLNVLIGKSEFRKGSISM